MAEPRTRVPPALVAAVACAVIATTWSALTHSMLLYGDARAHLDVARRVTDGLRPGLVQLGTVWLPLPHVFLVPLVAFTWLWHSGAAGAIIGGFCFVYSAFRVYTLVDELTDSRIGAWCAFAVYAGNLNLLYLQSTALTEPVLLAFLVGAIFHLARWLRTGSLRSMVLAASLTFCATLTRYEGWALLAAATVVVGLWTWVERRHPREAEANVLLFGVIGGYGVAMWLIYNLIIFHDPLYFIHSSYSAQSQQAVLAYARALTTQGHPVRSVLTYGWTVVDVLGPVVAAASALCAFGLVLFKGLTRRSLVILGLLAAPVAFNVISLWLGQTTVRVPQVSPHGLWNDRYGTMAVPLAAVTLGIAAARWRRLAPTVAGVAALGTLALASSTPITLKDGRVGTSSAADGHPELAATYLRRNYRGGEVLADDGLASPLIFASGLDLRQFVTAGADRWWRNALWSPSSSVAWIVAITGDAVSADMTSHPGRFRAFRLVMTDGLIRIYTRLPATYV